MLPSRVLGLRGRSPQPGACTPLRGGGCPPGYFNRRSLPTDAAAMRPPSPLTPLSPAEERGPSPLQHLLIAALIENVIRHIVPVPGGDSMPFMGSSCPPGHFVAAIAALRRERLPFRGSGCPPGYFSPGPRRAKHSALCTNRAEPPAFSRDGLGGAVPSLRRRSFALSTSPTFPPLRAPARLGILIA